MIHSRTFNKLIYFFMLAILLGTLPASSEEEIDLPEGFSLENFHASDNSTIRIPFKGYPHAISEIQHAEANQALTTFEGSPSSTVAGCVNAISGTFFESQVDLSSPCIQPLTVQRTYCSAEKEWFFRHMPLLKVMDGETSHLYASYVDDSGAGMSYRARHYSSETRKLSISSRAFEEHGLTNCGSEEISGQTSWRNSHLYFVRSEGKKFYLLRHGSHVDRLFGRYKRYGDHHQSGVQQGKFHLCQEIHPNGNKLLYEYNDDEELVQVQAISQSGQVLGALKVKQASRTTTWSAGQSSVCYTFDTKREKILRAAPSHAVPVTYVYDDRDRIISKKMPDERALHIGYYTSGKYKGNVHCLLAPVGSGQKCLKTHTFRYSSGVTEVEDVVGKLVKYYFDKESKRLRSIHHLDDKGIVISKESFSWGSNKGSHTGNLMKRTFWAEGNVEFSRTFAYDEFDNITQDNLLGNLTGNSMTDVYAKTFCSSQDGWNLPLEENDGRKQIVFAYYPKSNLLKKRLTKAENRILKREFFTYDDHGEVSQEIWDNGSGIDENDLTEVTERHLKVITARTQDPIGLPQTIEEFYLDRETGSYRLLKKTVNDYSLQGKLIHQELYGSDGVLAYTLQWEYDHLGNVTKHVNALGETTIYAHDANGNKVEEQGYNYRKKFYYDFSNRLIKEEEEWADGQHFSLSHRYNKLGQRTATIDIYGHETTYGYDAFGHIIEARYPPIENAENTLVPIQEKRICDGLGNVTDKWDGNGHYTKTLYTIRGQPYFIVYPDGSTERKTYTLDGLLETEIAKNGLSTIYKHDAWGHVTRTEVKDPTGNVLKTTSANYSISQVLSETDENGITTHYEYDGAGRKMAKIRENEAIKYVYDALGRIAKTIECQEGKPVRITAKEYDLLGRVIEERIEDETGKIFKKEQYRYDANGKQTHLISFTQTGLAATTVTTYTARNEIASVTDALGNTTHYAYNYGHFSNGQRVLQSTKTDPLGNQEIKTYDTHGHVGSLVQRNVFGAITREESYVYDLNGNHLFTKTTIFHPQAPPVVVITEWQYDAMGNIVHSIEAKDTPNEKHTQIIYNCYGQKESVRKPSGVVLSHAYDALGRLTEFQASDGSFHYTYLYNSQDLPICIADKVHGTTTLRTYDSCGNLTSECLGNGCTIRYAYDTLNRLLSVTLPDGSAIGYSYDALHLIEVKRIKNSQIFYTHAYLDYDLAGNILQEKFIGNAGNSSYRYDLLNRPIAAATPHWKESIPADGYNAVGNLLKREVLDGQGAVEYHYTYDDLYQILSEEGDDPHTYQYDSLCNRVAKNGCHYTVNALNQLLAQKDHSYVYDSNGCLTQKTNSKETISYHYDALDRLIEVRTPDAVITYVYDSFNRRLSKTENGKTIHFLYHGQNEIGAFAEGVMTELRILGNTRGAEVGAAIAFELQGKVFVPTHDTFGNVIALSDMTGQLLESYRYSVFGEMQAYPKNIGQEIHNPWRYSSKRLDPETGFLYFGQRYYAPEIGRWITPDPVGFEDGPNLYAYVHNQPLRCIDPDGRFAMFLIPIVASFAADYFLPAASLYLAEYAGGTAAAGFLTGLLRGYNESVFAPGLFGSIDPTASLFERGGMCLGAALSLMPGKLATKTGTVAAKAAGNFAVKEMTIAASSVAATRCSKLVSWFSSSCLKRGAVGQTAQKTTQAAEAMVTKIAVKNKERLSDLIIKETMQGKGNFTSQYRPNAAQVLEIGEKFVGAGYKPVGRLKDGIFRSADGLRQFRIDPNSLAGKHEPWVPHVHLERFKSSHCSKTYVNNHLPFLD